MADKLRKTFPLVVTHAEGEQPSHIKLNTIATQARNALGIVESAIGDLWGQGGDTVLTDFPLQITNLARQVGESKYLIPAIYPTVNDFFFVEDLSNRYAGKTQFYLLFKPNAAPTIESDPSSNMTSAKSSAREVIQSGDYHVDLATGKVTVFDPIPSASAPNIKYLVSPSSDWVRQQEVLPSIIPDVRTDGGFQGVRIENAGSGVFLLHLPPRGALTLDTEETPHNYPDASEVTLNSAGTLDTGDRRLWQDSTAAAFADAHYRYSFPKEVKDTLASLATGTVLPQGFLYLWDQAGKTIVPDVVFKKSSSSNPWTLQVESSNFDLSAVATADETPASYNSGYSLICPGASLSRSIWQLRNIILSAKHDNTGPEPVIDHNSLDKQNPPGHSSTGQGGRFPTSVNNGLDFWHTSRWEDDPHISLLSRLGSYPMVSGVNRDANNNALLGDLILANSVATTSGIFLDPTYTDDSFSIWFGDIDGPRVFAQNGVGLTVSPGTSSTDAGLTVTGGAQTDLTGTAGSGGTGLVATGGAVGGNGVVGTGTSAGSDGGATSGIGLTGTGGAGNATPGHKAGSGVKGTGGAGDGASGEGGAGVEGTGGTGATGGTGVKGTGTGTGPGGSFVGTSGYGVIAESDTSSPVRAALRMVPQDTDPTSPQEGDVYPNSTDNQLRFYDGSAWHTVGPGVDVQTFTSDGTWTKPTGAKAVTVVCIGSGAGGGSGRKGAEASDRLGGGGGGGGAVTIGHYDASVLGATETVTVGAAGTGGAAVSADDTNGNAGTNGEGSSFGTWQFAGGGGAGGGGTDSTSLGGGGGGSIGTASSGTGGTPSVSTSDGIGGQGPSGEIVTAHNAEWGGGSGGSSITNATAAAGGSSIYSAGGGGAGGARDSSNNFRAGGNGGQSQSYSLGGGGTGGTIGNAAGLSGDDNSTTLRGYGGEGGGGSGGGIGTANCGSGGDGGVPGGGGGGGGVNINGSFDSGPGGDGARGEVRVITYF